MQVEDQRFVDHRADVLSFETVPLEKDLTIAGEVKAHLFAATTGSDADWTAALQRHVERALVRGESNLMDLLSRDFEKILIAKALAHTGGRRIEAATLLGIGRNTITRKIAELGIADKNGSDEPA